MTDDATDTSKAGPDTVPDTTDVPSAPVQPQPATAGGLISVARAAQGLDQAALAAMLKIPLRRLDALEQGRHDELQGPTFERALAQAACRVLKIDAKPVLALLPRHETNILERVSEGINTPFRDRQGGSGGFGRGDFGSVLRPIMLVPLALVIAAAVLFYVPGSVWTRLAHPIVAGSESTAAGAASAPAVAGASTASNAGVSGAADTLAAAGSNALSASAAGVSPADSASASTAVAAAAAAPVASGVDEVLAHSEAAPNIPLQVIATTDSWVEVLDSQGHPLLSRTVVAGESVGLDGAMPMKVKIGNASGTRLTLRGDNVDLAPWTRDNVARLELK